MTSERRYTLNDLVAEALRAGLPTDKATVSRFVTLGLLDQAGTEGRRYKGGVLRTWPESQLGLLLTLLDKRRTIRSPRILANIPVSVWLLWGEQWVPLRQAQRALEVYAEVRRHAPRHDYPAAARRLVRDVAQPHADSRAKDALVDALVRSAREREFDEAIIGPLLVRVVGGTNPGEQADGTRVAAVLEAQWAARTRFYELTTRHFAWARMWYVYGQASYAGEWPALRADPRFGVLHQPFDLTHVVNAACRDLLFTLGMGLTMGTSAHLPEALRLEAWLEGRGHLETDIARRHPAFWLPDGQADGHLEISATVSVDPCPKTGEVNRTGFRGDSADWIQATSAVVCWAW